MKVGYVAPGQWLALDSTGSLWKATMEGNERVVPSKTVTDLRGSYFLDHKGLRVYENTGAKLLHRMTDPRKNRIQPAGNDRVFLLGPEGALLVSSSGGKKLVATGSGMNLIRAWDGPVPFWSASRDGLLRGWGSRGERLVRLRAHDKAVNFACMLKNPARLVTAGDDSAVRIWLLEAAAMMRGN